LPCRQRDALLRQGCTNTNVQQLSNVALPDLSNILCVGPEIATQIGSTAAKPDVLYWNLKAWLLAWPGVVVTVKAFVHVHNAVHSTAARYSSNTSQ